MDKVEVRTKEIEVNLEKKEYELCLIIIYKL